jgi:hypothetical protein
VIEELEAILAAAKAGTLDNFTAVYEIDGNAMLVMAGGGSLALRLGAIEILKAQMIAEALGCDDDAGN